MNLLSLHGWLRGFPFQPGSIQWWKVSLTTERENRFYCPWNSLKQHDLLSVGSIFHLLFFTTMIQLLFRCPRATLRFRPWHESENNNTMDDPALKISPIWEFIQSARTEQRRTPIQHLCNYLACPKGTRVRLTNPAWTYLKWLLSHSFSVQNTWYWSVLVYTNLL